MRELRAHHPTGKRGEAGFSLIEMLVAITILALVLAMLPGTFSLAHRTWDATAVLDQRARQDGGRSFLQARLAEAMPVFEPVGAGAVQLVFTGSAETLTFVAPSANGPQGAGLYRFTLETKPQGRGNALVVTVAPFVLKRGRDDAATAGRGARPLRRPHQRELPLLRTQGSPHPDTVLADGMDAARCLAGCRGADRRERKFDAHHPDRSCASRTRPDQLTMS